MSPVRTVREDDLLVLTFRRPILTVEALRAARAALGNVPAGVAALVIASDHPTVFLAGAHLGEIAVLGTLDSGAYAEEGRGLMAAVGAVPVPVVAAVHGSCAGGGLDLALATDWVVAAPAAALGHPGIRRGLVTGWGGTAELAGRLPPASMLGLLAGGELLPAHRAAALGLVDEIAENVAKAARRRARRLGTLGEGRMRSWRTSRHCRVR